MSIIDGTIGWFQLFLERKKWISEIPYATGKKSGEAVHVGHIYPMNFKKEDAGLFAHCTDYDTSTDRVYALSNVNISERGIVFKGFSNFWGAFPHTAFRADYGFLYILKNYLFRKKKKSDSNVTCILIYDFWSSANYYHWLVDALPRMFSVLPELGSAGYSLLLPANPPRFLLATLKYFNVANITFISKKEYLQAERLWVPYYLAGSGHIHPVKVGEVISYFRERISQSGPNERIYVSRSRQKARRIKNEDEVVKAVKEFGFTVIHFEDCTFEQQVAIGRGAKVFVSSHGANLTNLMFMNRGSHVLELIRRDKPNFCYWALASVAEHNYYYQLCDKVGNDHLLVNIEELRVNLHRILHE